MRRDPAGPEPQLDPHLLAEFRTTLKRTREADPEAWEASRRLVGQVTLQFTLSKLAAAVQRSASLSLPLQQALLDSLHGGGAEGARSLPGERLKHLTGLPPTKAVRALCVFFGVVQGARPSAPVSSWSPGRIEQFVRTTSNPFDLLAAADVASLLDLGAGDLSFAAELVEQYLPRLRAQQKTLILHCIDRLHARSTLGGAYRADPGRVQTFRQRPATELQFGFWDNQDMLALATIKKILPRYTIVTCNAPATPTFAYEPSRVSPSIIQEHLRQTKGEFRTVRVDGEEALEVRHAGRTLLFPRWKFDIRGPLALLDLLARKGRLCVLSAVDNEVFWELLSQLVEDERLRPPDVFFSPSILPDLFGDLYTKLASLRIGESLILADLAEPRHALPRVLEGPMTGSRSYRFRHVEIRRGAVFEGLPSSRTARLFQDMTEEVPPWFLVLVPEDHDT